MYVTCLYVSVWNAEDKLHFCVYVTCLYINMCVWYAAMCVHSTWKPEVDDGVSCSIAFYIMFDRISDWACITLTQLFWHAPGLVPSLSCQCWDHWLLSSGDQTQVHACMTITNWTPGPQIQFYFLGTVQCCPKTNRKMLLRCRNRQNNTLPN